MIRVTDRAAAQTPAMPWKKGLAVGRGYDLLRQDVLDHLAYLQTEIGFSYLRFHAIFHEDMNVVNRKPDGSLVFTFHHIDKILDSLIKLGFKPIIELNPMPLALASGLETVFYYQMNVTPPKVYAEWTSLIRAFTMHVTERYGRAAVREWYFEVWNEPNLYGFWTAGMAEYFELYAAAAAGVKAVDPACRVGGPATSKCCWVKELIDYATRHHVPLDFISTHLYNLDEYVLYPGRQNSPYMPGEFFEAVIRNTKQQIAGSARPDLPLLFTEWNSLAGRPDCEMEWALNPDMDRMYSGSFILDACKRLDQVPDMMCWWVASDIFEETRIPNTAFNGTYGLLNIFGMPKASFHAFRLLARLDGPLLDLAGDFPPFLDGLACRHEDSVRLLFWCHVPNELAGGAVETLVQLPRLAGRHRVICEHVKEGSGSALSTYQSLGSPDNLRPVEAELLWRHTQPAMAISECTGVLTVRLQPGEFVYYEIIPARPGQADRQLSEKSKIFDEAMGANSKS